jgi:kynurenine aminotransferase
MNFPPPKWITEAAEVALNNVASNHYSHPKGRIRLREALKSFYSPRFYRELDVENEILVTSGANEGLSSFEYFSMKKSRILQDNILFSLPS